MMFLQITTATSSGFFRRTYETLQYWDALLVPFYIFIILTCAYILRNIILEKEDKVVRQFFMWGLMLKMVGAIGLGLVYSFYYAGGDTSIYFSDSLIIHYAFAQNLNAWWHLMWQDALKIDPASYDYQWQMTLRNDPQGFFVDKIVSLVNMLTFRTYMPSAVIMATLSFTGTWSLYKVLTDIYPELKKQLGYAVFFIPSVFFWGSGIGKDSICFGSLGWLTWASYNIFIKQRKIFYSLVMMAISSYLIAKVKPYILFSFIPAMAFWVLVEYRQRITNSFFKSLSTPFTIVVAIASGYILLVKLGDEFSSYSITNAISTAQSFQDYHTFLAETANASGYNLGTFDGTITGALKMFFPAVNVTLFRPYLWEASSAIIFVSALESFGILLFTLSVFFRNGLLKPFSMIGKKPVILFAIIFALVFAYAVGFSAYNFGALVRYKIPCLPFFIGAMLMLDYELRKEKREAAEVIRRGGDVFVELQN